ncbi:16303_t:CDS:2 [Rhizophagus irregularis]|nr:16303_t:CDS:2 [Rhizophagus irregularis]
MVRVKKRKNRNNNASYLRRQALRSEIRSGHEHKGGRGMVYHFGHYRMYGHYKYTIQPPSVWSLHRKLYGAAESPALASQNACLGWS